MPSLNHLKSEGDESGFKVSLFPQPLTEVFSRSVFSNFYHLLKASKSKSLPSGIARMCPRILWHIWTGRNALVFEGKGFCPLQSLKIIKEDVDLWFLAQRVEVEIEECQSL
ncbi:unnamed protein product [Brassica oleracea var. botrytis]